MRFLLFRRPELLIAIATAWLLAMTMTAAAQGLASDSSATERLYKGLAEPTQIIRQATPFGEIVNQLKLRHKIEIHLDPSITAVGITATTPVTREIRAVSLGSALDLLLHDMDLDYAVKDEVILIASREAAARLVETRLYDVGDLVTNSRDGADLVAAVALVLPRNGATPDKAPLPPGPSAPAASANPMNNPLPNQAAVAAGPGAAAPRTSTQATTPPPAGEAVLIASPNERDVVLYHTSLAVRATFRGQRDVQKVLERLRDMSQLLKEGVGSPGPRLIRR